MIFWSLAPIFFQILSIQSETITDPTIKDLENLAPFWIADEIRHELRFWNVADRNKIIDFWFKRSWSDRDRIKDAYQCSHCDKVTPHGSKIYDLYCPLISAFQVISVGNLDALYKSSAAPPKAILGRTIHNDMKGKLNELGAIEECVCGNDKGMKDAIRSFYQEEYNDPIEDKLAHFRKKDKVYTHALTTYCWKGLCQEKKIKPEDAEKEAKCLRNIDPEKDKENFQKKLNELLDKHCEPDLKLIFQKYRKNNDGIDNAVYKAFDVERQQRIYHFLVKYIEDTCKLYADQLNSAMDGAGTDTTKINRIILTRCERDLACILKKFKEIYKKSFMEKLKSETRLEGRYRQAIEDTHSKTGLVHTTVYEKKDLNVLKNRLHLSPFSHIHLHGLSPLWNSGLQLNSYAVVENLWNNYFSHLEIIFLIL